jgi:hypothetical protein
LSVSSFFLGTAFFAGGLLGAAFLGAGFLAASESAAGCARRGTVHDARSDAEDAEQRAPTDHARGADVGAGQRDGLPGGCPAAHGNLYLWNTKLDK